MLNWLLQPWPWWFSGLLMGLTVPILYLLSGKSFGISSSLQHVGSICSPGTKISYLRDNDWRKGLWNLVFVVGIMLGAAVATTFLSAEPVHFLPASAYSPFGMVRLLLGGVFVGFGVRYAGGCTSGHTITGLSNLNWPSLVATLSFFAGGVFVTWLFGPLLN